MAQQTAVEWLDRWFRDNPEATHEEANKALERAKQMEKDQIIEAFTKGELVPSNYYNDPIPFNITGKNYYYATYGKKEML